VVSDAHAAAEQQALSLLRLLQKGKSTISVDSAGKGLLPGQGEKQGFGQNRPGGGNDLRHRAQLHQPDARPQSGLTGQQSSPRHGGAAANQCGAAEVPLGLPVIPAGEQRANGFFFQQLGHGKPP